MTPSCTNVGAALLLGLEELEEPIRGEADERDAAYSSLLDYTQLELTQQ